MWLIKASAAKPLYYYLGDKADSWYLFYFLLRYRCLLSCLCLSITLACKHTSATQALELQRHMRRRKRSLPRRRRRGGQCIEMQADVELISRSEENVTSPNRFFNLHSNFWNLQNSPRFLTLDLLRGTKFISWWFFIYFSSRAGAFLPFH